MLNGSSRDEVLAVRLHINSDFLLRRRKGILGTTHGVLQILETYIIELLPSLHIRKLLWRAVTCSPQHGYIGISMLLLDNVVNASLFSGAVTSGDIFTVTQPPSPCMFYAGNPPQGKMPVGVHNGFASFRVIFSCS